MNERTFAFAMPEDGQIVSGVVFFGVLVGSVDVLVALSVVAMRLCICDRSQEGLWLVGVSVCQLVLGRILNTYESVVGVGVLCSGGLVWWCERVFVMTDRSNKSTVFGWSGVESTGCWWVCAIW